ncbi:glycolate oxidase FAD binding subunit [Catenuloplanes nepalensis]|uniref:Glycolate oxidase FAD binding subunit n=1 Tax=Catenuloplanes nepalensis TaxID=587533 RepID=A0ABT9MVC8_9ACTN|nr:FAD-binding oxidoreductase [Catenuloplanes nepalensis]MDP9795402.1 glycolate oxidase FAD binding subunit [Catenuloplanes nepalensis]
MTRDALDALGDVCERAGPADEVAGVRAAYVARPGDAAQVADVLRAAAAHDLAVVARGGGTRLHWGLPPARADLVLDLSGLDRIVDHAAGDLVLIAEAGARVADVQRRLATAGQRLAVDAPTPGATLGGTVATGHSGPSRLLAGPIKDQIIGISVVRADGTPASSGGRVVKNVAGYDLGRLMCGSYGTLAVLTRLIFRLRPLPAARAFVTAPVLGPSLAAPLIEAVAAAQLVPSAIELHLPAPPHDDAAGPATGAVVVLVEGAPAGVAARAAAVRDLLRRTGAEEVHVRADAPPGWGTLPTQGLPAHGLPAPDLPAHSLPARVVAAQAPAAQDLRTTGGGTLLRLTFVRSGLPAVLSAARDAGAAVSGSAAAGVLTAMLGPGPGERAMATPEHVAAALARLRTVCARHGGGAIVLDAPAAVRDAVDVWGPVPALDLMRRVKAQFDPAHRLSPGRFVGGI